MNRPIAILGAGAWGTALAILLAKNQQKVHLWDADLSHIQSIERTHCNQRNFPNVKLSNLICACQNLSDSLLEIQDILIAVPSHAFTNLIKQLLPFIPENLRIAWATKGLDPKTSRFFHEIVNEVVGPNTPKAALSGPSFAREVAEGKPTHIVLATQNDEFAQDLSFRLYNEHFKIELSHDMIGVQLCGALKNILAIVIGISDGLNLGANARSTLITKALQEMVQFGKALGAQPATFMGPAGLGDIILTCTDNQSRNRRFGFALGEGKTIKQAEQEISETIEGKNTTLEAYQLMQQHEFHCHFIEKIHGILYYEKSAQDAIYSLLA